MFGDSFLLSTHLPPATTNHQAVMDLHQSLSFPFLPPFRIVSVFVTAPGRVDDREIPELECEASSSTCYAYDLEKCFHLSYPRFSHL